MKKTFFLLSIMMLIVLTSCSGVVNTSDAKQTGYSDYNISSNDNYLCDEPLETSENARNYYLDNKRVCDGFVITDFLDGVCINQFLNQSSENNIIEVPNEIEGKPVLKVGCSYKTGKGKFDATKDILPALDFAEGQGASLFTVKMSKNIKYISKYAFDFLTDPSEFSPVEIVVDKNNEYYSSEKGCLYNKNKTRLLYVPFSAMDNNDFTVPDSVTSFEPSNGLINAPYKLHMGAKISTIEASIYQSDTEGFYPIEHNGDTEIEFSICGKKNSSAEKWAKNNNINFIME